MKPFLYIGMNSFIYIAMIILLYSDIIHVICDEGTEYFHIDKSDWIEPSNMFEDQHQTPTESADLRTESADLRTESADQTIQSPDTVDTKTMEDCIAVKEKWALTKEQLAISEKEVKTLRSLLASKSCGYKASAFFKRIAFKTVSKIDKLIAHSKSLDGSSGIYLHIDISHKEMGLLQTLKLGDSASECSFVENFDKVACRLIDSAYLGNKPSFWIEHYDYITGTILTFCIGYAFIIRRGYLDKVILLLIIGTLWEWKRMYEAEINKRSLNYGSIPKGCHSDSEISWTRSLTSWMMNGIYSAFSFKVHAQESAANSIGGASSGVCSNYYASLAVNPLLDVNPIEAFSHVVALLLFRPLVQLGDYSGRATTSFFAHIPIGYLPIILPSTLFVIALIILGMFRYSLSIPFIRIAPVAQRIERFHPTGEEAPRLPTGPSHQIVTHLHTHTIDGVLPDLPSRRGGSEEMVPVTDLLFKRPKEVKVPKEVKAPKETLTRSYSVEDVSSLRKRYV